MHRREAHRHGRGQAPHHGHGRDEAPLGDPIEVTVRGYELTLRKDEAQCIEVTDIARA